MPPARPGPRSRLHALGACLALALTASPSAHAFCGFNDDLPCAQQLQPVVCRVDASGDALVVEPGGVSLGTDDLRVAQRPRLRLGADAVWRSVEPGPPRGCTVGADSCAPALDALLRPAVPPLDRNEVVKLYGCSQRRGAVWFAVERHSGAGISSAVGRYDRGAGIAELRPLPALEDASIGAFAVVGDVVWVGVYRVGESRVEPSDDGLVRYDWGRGRVVRSAGEDDGPCGSFVTGIVSRDEEVWVGSDVGLSRFSRRTQTWTHFRPVARDGGAMRPATCEDLYSEVLRAARRRSDAPWLVREIEEAVGRTRPSLLPKLRRAGR